jgi:SEC-C motif domain protein
MRSRYAAYALGVTDYVFRTWHPRTRPDHLAPDPGLTWNGLEILGSGEGWVEFVASYDHDGRPGQLRERSRFERRGGRWMYVDGDVG